MGGGDVGSWKREVIEDRIYIIYLIVASSFQLLKSFLIKFIICKKIQENTVLHLSHN